jgi:hypothetical protein
MLQFCVLTYNIQTLNGAENRTNIEQQLISKVLVAGIQESRSKKSGIKLSDSGKYINVTSAKDAQGLGIEIWIATGIPVAQIEKKKTYIKKDNINIVYRDSREILIYVQSNAAQFYVSAVHGPWANNGETKAAAKTWWENHLIRLQTHTGHDTQESGGGAGQRGGAAPGTQRQNTRDLAGGHQCHSAIPDRRTDWRSVNSPRQFAIKIVWGPPK